MEELRLFLIGMLGCAFGLIVGVVFCIRIFRIFMKDAKQIFEVEDRVEKMVRTFNDRLDERNHFSHPVETMDAPKQSTHK